MVQPNPFPHPISDLARDGKCLLIVPNRALQITQFLVSHPQVAKSSTNQICGLFFFSNRQGAFEIAPSDIDLADATVGNSYLIV